MLVAPRFFVSRDGAHATLLLTHLETLPRHARVDMMLDPCDKAVGLAQQILHLDPFIQLSVVIKIGLRVGSIADDHWLPQLLLALSQAPHVCM